MDIDPLFVYLPVAENHKRHVFQDEFLMGGTLSIFEVKMERILLSYKSCSILLKQSPGCLLCLFSLR